jgi:hypothetical protein
MLVVVLTSQLGYRPPGSVLELELPWNDLTVFHNDSEFAVLAKSDSSARPARLLCRLIRQLALDECKIKLCARIRVPANGLALSIIRKGLAPVGRHRDSIHPVLVTADDDGLTAAVGDPDSHTVVP